MHRSFRLLLGEIRRQTDFDADDSRISVQYFPSREGGCEMFICDLQQDGEATKESDGSNLPLPLPHRQLRPYKKRNGSFRKDCAHRFEKLAHLLSACRRLLGADCIVQSSLFLDENGEYLLLLTVFAQSPYATPEEIEFINEYGVVESAPAIRLYIREHAKEICSLGAIETMAALA